MATETYPGPEFSRPARRVGTVAPPRPVARSWDFAAEAMPHFDRIHALARRIVRPPLDAEEFTQETFLRAYAAYERFVTGSDMRAWLTTILLNLVRGEVRRHRPVLVPLPDPAEGAEIAAIGRVDVDAIRNLTRASVHTAIDALPEDFRLAIALVDIVGLPVKEAAGILDCPVGTVLSRLSRGRKRLARALARELADDV